MSAVFPQTIIEQIQFCESHTPAWSLSPGAVGLTPGQLAGLVSATEAAREAYGRAQSARQASKATTLELGAAAAAMSARAGDLIRQIKAFAQLQPIPAAVYTAAQIPEPLAPSPMPAPGAPTNIAARLDPGGAVTISWTASDAAMSGGVFYTVARKLPGQAAFLPIGGAPGTTSRSRTMSFTDAALPAVAAAGGARYIIQGRRGAIVGEPSPAIVVQFGVDGGGVQVAGATLKMAA